MATSPGRILAAILTTDGTTQADLARRTGMSTKHINQIIKGTATLTHRTALLLERETGVPAPVWCLIETLYRIEGFRESTGHMCAGRGHPLTQPEG